MKRIDKLLLTVIGCVLFLGVWGVANSGNITNTGWTQKDVVTFLTNTVTMCNELKSDHNVVMGSYSSARTGASEIISDHNTILVSYSTARVQSTETAADLNTILNSFSSIRADYTTLRSQYNDLWVNFSTLNEMAGRTGGFSDITGTQKIIAGSQRVTGSADASVLTGARVAATADTTVITGARTSASADSTIVSGGRTTTTDLTLTGL